MTPYRRGYAFERRVEEALRRSGWRTLRSAGSHDPVDLLAWRPSWQPSNQGTGVPRRIVALQVKRNGQMGVRERDALWTFTRGLTAEVYCVRAYRRKLQIRAVGYPGRWDGPWMNWEDVV